MGSLLSRRIAGVEDIDIQANSAYRYPPKSGEARASVRRPPPLAPPPRPSAQAPAGTPPRPRARLPLAARAPVQARGHPGRRGQRGLRGSAPP